MITGIKEKVARHFDEDPGHISVSKFFHSQANRNKKILFYAATKERPLCLVKVIRDSAFNAVLENEYSGQKNSPNAPKILFESRIANRFMFAEELVDGIPIGIRDAPRYLKTVYDYQCRITRTGVLPVAAVTEFLKKFDCADSRYRDLLANLGRRTGSISLSHSHGDLTYMNILKDRNGNLTIVDWERYNERPVWGIDFIHYCIRCFNLLHFDEASRSLDRMQFIKDPEYFKTIFLIDSLLDFIQKKAPADYDKIMNVFHENM